MELDFELEAIITYNRIIEQIEKSLNKPIDKTLIMKSSDLPDCSMKSLVHGINRVINNCQYIDTYAERDMSVMKEAANRLKKMLSIIHIAVVYQSEAAKRIIKLRDKKAPSKLRRISYD